MTLTLFRYDANEELCCFNNYYDTLLNGVMIAV